MTTQRARKPKQRDKKPGWRQAFLAAFAIRGNVTAAAECAKINRQTVYALLKADPKFRAAFDEAEAQSVERLYEEARRRAVEGVERPVVSGGQIVCYTRDYSDTLMCRLLSARDPRFREKGDSITVNGKDCTVKVIKGASMEEL